MKVRSDFVTNSSSSSFIIGKVGDETTVDAVFNMIKGFYTEFFEKINVFKKVCDKYNLYWDETECRFKDKKGSLDNIFDLNRKIEKEYGFSLFDYYGQDLSWMNFKTYQEYEDYWYNRIIETHGESYIEAPFSIIDYTSDKPRKYIENGWYGIKSLIEGTKDEDDAGSEVIEWYVSCAEEIFEGKDESEIFSESSSGTCEYCYFHRGTSRSNRKDADHVNCEMFKKLKAGELTKDSIITAALGKICIHSECGKISDYVVGKLLDVASFGCNHMG